MKVIFIFPALVLTFPQFFLRAVEFIDTHLKNHFHWIRTVFTVWIVNSYNSICGGYYQHDPIALFPQNGLIKSQPSCQHNIEPKEGKSAFMRYGYKGRWIIFPGHNIQTGNYKDVESFFKQTVYCANWPSTCMARFLDGRTCAEVAVLSCNRTTLKDTSRPIRWISSRVVSSNRLPIW